jgi:hypothetical protein
MIVFTYAKGVLGIRQCKAPDAGCYTPTTRGERNIGGKKKEHGKLCPSTPLCCLPLRDTPIFTSVGFSIQFPLVNSACSSSHFYDTYMQDLDRNDSFSLPQFKVLPFPRLTIVSWSQSVSWQRQLTDLSQPTDCEPTDGL